MTRLFRDVIVQGDAGAPRPNCRTLTVNSESKTTESKDKKENVTKSNCRVKMITSCEQCDDAQHAMHHNPNLSTCEQLKWQPLAHTR